MELVRGVEVLVGPPIKQMVYDAVTRSMLVYCEHADKTLLAVGEDGSVAASFGCHVQHLRIAQRNCFVLHGPMISILQLDRLSEKPVLVTNFEGKGFVRLLACASDGSFLASSSGQPQVLLTPQDDKLPQKWIEAHADCVTALAACGMEGNAFLFTGARDGRIRKWNVAACEKPVHDVSKHSSMVTHMVLMLGERVLLSVSTDNTMRLWAAETCEQLAIIRLNRTVLFVREHQNVVYSFCDTGLILGWTLLKDFALGDFRPVHKTFCGHHGAVTDVCFLGSVMISSSMDATVRVWNVETGACMNVLRGHQSPVVACCANTDSKSVFSAGQDGTLYRWELAQTVMNKNNASSMAVSEPLLLLDGVMERLRVTASLIAAVVVQWLDPFLEASAAREMELKEEGDPDDEAGLEGLAEGSQEAEEESIAMFRAALRSVVSDSDLWQVYNCRSALHELHLAFSGMVVALEMLPASANPDLTARAFRAQCEELFFTLEHNHAANQKLCFAIAALFKRPKIRSVWERRTGAAVPHLLLRDTVTLVADFLRSWFFPLACLIKQADAGSGAKADFSKALAMAVQMWSVMGKGLDFSDDQIELMWGDSAVSKLCQCSLLEGKMAGFLSSLSSSVQASVFAKCSCDNVEEKCCECLLQEMISLPLPLFPDLHECLSSADLSLSIKSNKSAPRLGKMLSLLLSFSSDCSHDVMGAVLGPLLSQSASLNEAALTVGPATQLLASATVLFPKQKFSPPRTPDVTLTRAAPANRVRIGHEHENRSFGAVFYSLQMMQEEGDESSSSKLQTLLFPASSLSSSSSSSRQPLQQAPFAPAPSTRGPAEKIARRASKILKKTFAALDKRKSLAIEKVAGDSGRDARRASAFDISPADYANSLIGDSSAVKSSGASGKRHSLSAARSAPSFSWNDLIGLLDDEEQPKGGSNASNTGITVSGNVSAGVDSGFSEFRPWDEPASLSVSAVVSTTSTSTVVNASDEEIGAEMQSFLGLDGQSWREVIAEDSDEGEGAEGTEKAELAAEFSELLLRVPPVSSSSSGMLSPTRKLASMPSSQSSPVAPRRNPNINNTNNVAVKSPSPPSSKPTLPDAPSSPLVLRMGSRSSVGPASSSVPSPSSPGFSSSSPLPSAPPRAAPRRLGPDSPTSQAPRKPPPRPGLEQTAPPSRLSRAEEKPAPKKPLPGNAPDPRARLSASKEPDARTSVAGPSSVSAARPPGTPPSNRPPPRPK